MSQPAGFPWFRRTKVWAFLSAAGVLGLVLFHLQLLWSRVVDQTLTEPGVVLKWLLAGGVVAGLGWLHRRGVPLWGDRRALALWLIALCLHTGTAVAPALPLTPAEPWLLLPLSAVLLGAAVVFLGALSRVRRRAVRRPRPTLFRRGHTRGHNLAATGPGLLPRPPPVFVRSN